MAHNLAQRGVSSIKWNIIASGAHLLLAFLQTTLLARLLPIETFGIYSAVMAVIGVAAIFAVFGMGGAFLHRAPETQDIDRAASLHFTLTLIITTVWAGVMLAGVMLLVDAEQHDLRTAFLVVIGTKTVVHLTHTPRVYLSRQVKHRRLAVIDIILYFLTAVVSVGLALTGATLWALLAGNILEAVVSVIGLYIWRPVWRPRLTWSVPGFRYFLTFGSRQFAATLLLNLLDKVDDIWTGSYLGTLALGYYSRAYQFAKLPSYTLASPINNVAAGIYAELVGDSETLSRAFARINVLMIRSGFFLAGAMALIAPELIHILIGERWLPMIDAFRLMLIFALFDPMKQTIGSLFTAVGKPGLLARVRFIQFIAMILGLFALGPLLGIAGVALAVNLMLAVGIALLLRYARVYVQFSLKQFFAVPLLAVGLGLAAGSLALVWLEMPLPVWVSAGLKFTVFTISYALVLLVWDRQNVRDALQLVHKYVLVRPQRKRSPEPESKTGA
ncbi:MAG TPA: oligosaccharide flippase family protein [Spirillospora sp.]|nr:oligosaccharide flippase family protein [Spirillospora sp.]